MRNQTKIQSDRETDYEKKRKRRVLKLVQVIC